MTNKPLIIGTGLRGKVERLLRGEVHIEDVHDLFFSMRDLPAGSGIVSEIANFLAHPQREQGFVWRDVNDEFEFLKWKMPNIQNKIITADLPASLPNALRANMRRVRKTVLRQTLRMNRAHAEKVLSRVLNRLVPIAPGRVSKLSAQSQEEYDVVTLIASFIKGGSLFSGDDLCEDFSRALLRQNLLKSTEKPMLKKHKAALSLFALAAMHNRVIKLNDGTTAKVVISEDKNGNLGVFALSEVAPDRGPGVTSALIWIFETNLPVAKYCEPLAAPVSRSPFIGDFKMTAAMKLARIS